MGTSRMLQTRCRQCLGLGALGLHGMEFSQPEVSQDAKLSFGQIKAEIHRCSVGLYTRPEAVQQRL